MEHGKGRKPGPNALTYFSHYLTPKEQLALLLVVILVTAGAVTYFSGGSASSPALEENDQALSSEPDAEAEPPEIGMEPPEAIAEGDSGDPSPTESPEEDAEPETPSRIHVAVRGAVRLEGAHALDADARVGDLLDRARLRDEADISELNLAAPLIDGTTLVVPRRSEASVDGDRLVLRRGRSARELNPEQYIVGGWRPSAPAQGESSAPPARPSSPGSADEPAREDGLIDLNSASQSELETLPGIGPVYAQAIIDHRRSRPFTQVEDVTAVPGIGPRRLESMRDYVTVNPR